ncbi:MAG TPA: helical backbone metal receptor [Micromonosporaceae bacterium]
MRRVFAVTLTALALLAAGGCATNDPGAGATPTATAAHYPVTVGSLTLAKRPERIVSFSATATEMLFAIDAGSQVVAVDSYSTYPTNAPKTDLSAYKPNVEAIAKYQPDLVVLSNDTEKIVSQLAALKIPTFLAPAAETLDDTYRQIDEFGQLTGHRAEATALVGRMRDDVAKLLASVPKRATALRYYYELDQTYYSVTSKTFIGSLFASAGLVNIADELSKDGNPYPQLSAEAIVNASPDLIFLADTKCCGQTAATVAGRAGWSGITAVRDGGVVELDDDIASRWGPRVVDLLRSITDAAAKAK